MYPMFSPSSEWVFQLGFSDYVRLINQTGYVHTLAVYPVALDQN